MAAKRIALNRVLGSALVLASFGYGVAASAPATRCIDASDAGAVVQRANAPARRVNAPAASPTLHEHEPGTPACAAQAKSLATAKLAPVAPAPVTASAPAGATAKPVAMHDSTSAAPATARHAPAAAARPASRPTRVAPSASGMKTLVELSQSGGRVVG